MSSLNTWLRSVGLDARRFLGGASSLRRYWSDRKRFRAGLDPSFAWGCEFPILGEWDESSGNLGAYFHQDLLVARWILEADPLRHVDVGSRIDGFVGNLSLFREVEVLDIRPQLVQVPNVRFRQLDLLAELPTEWQESTPSLSCLHTIEHFGLGRYGDAIDANGHQRGLAQLKSMVAPGGMLYLSTPMGPQRVEFNAHRVFSAKSILGWFEDRWEIERFAVINDKEEVLVEPARELDAIEVNFGCQLGVGIVAARKHS